MEKVPLYCGGREAGELRAAEEGVYVTFHALCRPTEPALLRAYVIGQQGELRLGVLAPENGAFTIRRRFSKNAVRPLGRLLRGEARPCGEESAAWEPMGDPEERFPGGLPRRLLAGVTGVLTRREGRLHLAALPWEDRGPFPLPELFCFARVEQIEKQRCVVFAFDDAGEPVMPEKNGRRTGS